MSKKLESIRMKAPRGKEHFRLQTNGKTCQLDTISLQPTHNTYNKQLIQWHTTKSPFNVKVEDKNAINLLKFPVKLGNKGAFSCENKEKEITVKNAKVEDGRLLGGNINEADNVEKVTLNRYVEGKDKREKPR